MSIVPRAPLLIWVALLGFPLAGLVAVSPESVLLVVIVTMIALMICAVDAALALDRLTAIQVALPPLVRLVKGKRGSFPLTIRDQGKDRRRIRVAWSFPPGVTGEHDEIVAPSPDPNSLLQLKIECHPLRRGCHWLAGTAVAAPSRLRLWEARDFRTDRCELRVYPDLSKERRKLAMLFLNRGAFGMHVRRQMGKGREFEKLREYLPGDSVEDIHWKATAKRSHPVTKVFQIERTQEVYVILDASRLSARLAPTAAGVAAVDPQSEVPATLLERYVTGALTLGSAAQQQGDHFGLLLYSDRVQSFLRAKNGPNHFSQCRDALFAAEPRAVAPDLDELSAFIQSRLRRRALLVFFTSLDDPVLAEQFLAGLNLIARRHLVVVLMVQPASAQPLFADERVEQREQICEKLGGHLLWNDLQEIELKLQRRGIRFSLVPDERLVTTAVRQYLAVKGDQTL